MNSNLGITTINDEISPDLHEVIEFLKSNDLDFVELRTINKINLVDYTLEQVSEMYKLLQEHGISVSAFASPLFKWFPDGSQDGSVEQVDTFGFNPHLSFDDKKKYIVKAIQVAKMLHTSSVRIFSTLRVDGFEYSFEDDPLLQFALNEASKEGVVLMIENEPPCYIHKMVDIKLTMEKYGSEYLKVWFDVSNFYKVDDRVLMQDFVDLKGHIGYFHFKDFDEDGVYCPFGTGVINYKRIVTDIKNILFDESVYLSIETHVRSNPVEATAVSLANLRLYVERSRVRYGVVGCGSTFMKHGSAIYDSDFGELGAVYDIDSDRASNVAAQLDCEVKFDLSEMLDDATVDILNIRTPNYTHSNLVMQTLDFGKFCLCEKPFCLTSAEGEEVLQNSNYNKNVFVNYQNRFNPAVVRLFEYLESGRFGEILFCSVQVRWWRDDSYFKDWHGDISQVGGMLFNQGPHALDLMLKVCGEVNSVQAVSSSVRKNIELDDFFVANVVFKNGSLGNLEITTHTTKQNCEASIFVVGEKGSLKLGGYAFNQVEFSSFEIDDNQLSEKNSQEKEAVESNHSGLIRSINAQILYDSTDYRLAYAEDGLAVVKFIEKLYIASKE